MLYFMGINFGLFWRLALGLPYLIWFGCFENGGILDAMDSIPSSFICKNHIKRVN